MNSDHERWKNRRRMAWLCVFAGCAYPMLVLWSASKELGEIAMPFYLFVGSVAGAYIGFATYDDKWKALKGDSNAGAAAQ